MSFDNRLAAARRQANITQESLADALGVSRQAVSKWESDLSMPESEKLPQIARLLNVSIDALMGIKTEERCENLQTNEPKQTRTLVLSLGTSFEYKSRRTVRGIPLLHIHVGFGKKAHGIVAIGSNATGVIALGFLAKGVISLGLLSLGLLPFGLLSIGLLAFGTLALGVFAAGAIACGLFAIGAIAIGCYAMGALAIGLYGALGDQAFSALGMALGKTRAKGMAVLFPQEAFRSDAIAVAIAHVKCNAPTLLRPLASLFAKCLSLLP